MAEFQSSATAFPTGTRLGAGGGQLLISLNSSFKASYVRTNRVGGAKHMLCFPACDPRVAQCKGAPHCDGHAIRVRVQGRIPAAGGAAAALPKGLRVCAQVVDHANRAKPISKQKQRKNKKSTTSSAAAAASEADSDLPRPNYSVGDIVGEVALERASRSIQFPCRPLMNGLRIGGLEDTAHTLKEDFLVNPDCDPVHYGWRSHRSLQDCRHSLRVYVFVPVGGDEGASEKGEDGEDGDANRGASKGTSEVVLRCVGFQDSPTFTMSSQRRAGRNTPLSAGSNFKFKRPSVAGVIDGSGHHDRAFEYGNTDFSPRSHMSGQPQMGHSAAAGFVAANGACGADGGEQFASATQLGNGGWPPLLAGAWGSQQPMNAAAMNPLAMMLASNPQMAAAMMGGMAGMMGGMGAMGMGLGGAGGFNDGHGFPGILGMGGGGMGIGMGNPLAHVLAHVPMSGSMPTTLHDAQPAGDGVVPPRSWHSLVGAAAGLRANPMPLTPGGLLGAGDVQHGFQPMPSHLNGMCAANVANEVGVQEAARVVYEGQSGEVAQEVEATQNGLEGAAAQGVDPATQGGLHGAVGSVSMFSPTYSPSSILPVLPAQEGGGGGAGWGWGGGSVNGTKPDVGGGADVGGSADESSETTRKRQRGMSEASDAVGAERGEEENEQVASKCPKIQQ